MKTIKNLVLVLAITFASVISASSNTANEEPSALATEIGVLLESPNFKITNELLAKVTFVLNQDNEIVVLNVVTDNSQLEDYIKSRLNYSKLSKKVATRNKTYVVPVRLAVK